MDLIQKAKNRGCVIKNDEYYLWEIQKWLREEHKIIVTVNPRWKKPNPIHKVRFAYDISTIHNYWGGFDDNLDRFLEGDYNFHVCDTYEEALEQGLLEALKLITDET